MSDTLQRQLAVTYCFEGQPREFLLEAPSDRDLEAAAAKALIERHWADAENRLLMPRPEAGDAELIEQAAILGITDIRVASRPAAC